MGGDIVTLSGPTVNGSDITLVTLNGVQADILSQTASTVTIQVNNGNHMYAFVVGNITTNSTIVGIAILVIGCAYIPSGMINIVIYQTVLFSSVC